MCSIRIVQPFLRLTRQHNTVTLRLQKCLQLFCIDKIQLFFIDSTLSDHAGVVTAVARVKDDRALCCLRVPAALLTVF